MPTHDYRRDLSRQEELRVLGLAGGAALGVGAAVGVVAWYLARVLAQRVPLKESAPARVER